MKPGPQVFQAGKIERVYFQCFDADDELIAPAPAGSALLTVKEPDGTIFEDNGAVPLEDVGLTLDGTGYMYYSIFPAAAETVSHLLFFPYATLSSIATAMDVPIVALVRSEEETPTTENYCYVEDIASFTGRDFTTNSQPTRNEVQELIDFICGQINDYLRYQYDTPITGTRALSQLKMFAKIGVAAQIESSIPRGRADHAALLERKYNQYLKEIKAGTVPLTTTSAEGAEIAEPRMSHIIGGLGTDTAIESEDKEHFFSTKDKW